MDEDDEKSRTLKETLSQDELNEYFESDFSFIFFRLSSLHKDKSLKDIIGLLRDYSFWMPQFIWCKGKLIDTYHIQAEDDEGNTIGVRF